MTASASVVVVDDDDDIRRLVATALRSVGHAVSEVADPDDVLEQVGACSADLVVLDINMPGRDGFEVLRLLRARPATSGVPVIFLTAYHDPEVVVRGLQLGAVDFVRKPFEPAELIARVDVAVRIKRAQDSFTSQLETTSAEARADALTGLPNRRALEDELARLACAEQPADRASVIVIDVDRFKSVNDRFGHRAGDQLLVEVAGALRATLRAGELYGRWGGDEFVVLLPGEDAVAAASVAERVRAAVEGLDLPRDLSVVYPSVSCGVATVTGLTMRTVDNALVAADAAMYRAKALGRNKVVRADRS